MTVQIRVRRTPPPEVGLRLAAARQRAGLAGREAARRLGTSSGYLADLERGRRCPSVGMARRLADVLALTEAERADLFACAVDDAGANSPWRKPAAETALA
jgi:transcriptional regulator with XRE-family HTH domain